MLKIAWNENYCHPLPLGHRFPMEKYELLPEQLVYEGTITADQLFKPHPVSISKILGIHSTKYWEKLKDLNLSRAEERRTGFPLSEALVQREITIIGGTVECCEYAMQYGIAMNVAGGTHHAFQDFGEGFCLLNDIAVAAQNLLDIGNVKQILIVDLDVHQGNGTAKVFENEPRVFTFSMHGAKNFPSKKEKSDLDIELPDQTDGKKYLHLLKAHLENLILRILPDFIFYQCGVDVLEEDQLGRLSLSLQDCKSRDRHVLQLARQYEIPLVAVMGGGYSPSIKTIIEAHANTFRLAQETYFW